MRNTSGRDETYKRYTTLLVKAVDNTASGMRITKLWQSLLVHVAQDDSDGVAALERCVAPSLRIRVCGTPAHGAGLSARAHVLRGRLASLGHRHQLRVP